MCNKNPFVRRNVVGDISSGKYNMSDLMHMMHYDKSADLMIQESKRLGRPIDVVSVGCGSMWELMVLVNGRWVPKKDVIHSYVGIDAIKIDPPISDRMMHVIGYKHLCIDMMDDASYPLSIGDESIDLIICNEFIEHIDKEHAQKCLLECAAIARPGAVMYLSSPNAPLSIDNDKYHIYEWELNELLNELNPYWDVDALFGTYINKRTFDRVNAEQGKVPEKLVKCFRHRFSNSWCRIMLAAPYPEYSGSYVMELRRVDGA